MKSVKVYPVLCFKSFLHSFASHQVRFLPLSALFGGLIGRCMCACANQRQNYMTFESHLCFATYLILLYSPFENTNYLFEKY